MDATGEGELWAFDSVLGHVAVAHRGNGLMHSLTGLRSTLFHRPYEALETLHTRGAPYAIIVGNTNLEELEDLLGMPHFADVLVTFTEHAGKAPDSASKANAHGVRTAHTDVIAACKYLAEQRHRAGR